MQPIFICGIGTEVGKTVVSSVILQNTGFAYWKPVQTGTDRDLETVRQLVSRQDIIYYDECYRLNLPASPHAAARHQGIVIDTNRLQLPQSENILIEGAGGLMVPLTDEGVTFLDMIKQWNATIIIVSKHYLGSINHTLLTWYALKNNQIPLLGLVFNNHPEPLSEEVICRVTGLPVLLRLRWHDKLNHQIIKKYAEEIDLTSKIA